MSVTSTRIAVEFLGRLAADREAGELAPLADYLARYPGHEEVVAEEYLRARGTAAPDGADGADDDEHDVASATAGEPSEAASDAPQTVGPYLLLEELGRGGQAVVWKARDPWLDRLVALKVVPRPPGARGLSARFQREARATASLEHPNVCALYDSGVDAGCAWLAMQYVEGQTLERWLEAAQARRGPGQAPGPDDLEAVLALVEAAARALHAAHTRGIVHRDIKPANIMVRPDGEPVLLDFGVALLVEDGPQLTRSGTSLGTPAYMSPEQLGGDRGDVGPATDVWSLGATLYEACCGQRAYPQGSYEALVRAILETEPIDPRRLSPHLSRDLTAVIQTALCKRLAGRYRSALDLADDLRRVRERRPTLARTVGPLARLARWSARNPLIAGMSGVLVLAVLAGTLAVVDRNRALGSSNAALTESNAQLVAESESRAQEARAKAAALAEYERMADIMRLRDARQEAQALFPLHPDLVGALEAWQARHAALFARLPQHEQRLESLRAGARAYTEADRRRDHAEAFDKAARIEASLPAIYPDGREPFVREREALLASTATRLSWDFGDDVDTQFRHDQLAELTAQLAAFVRGDDGVVADVARRLTLCRAMQEQSVTRHAQAWEAALARVAAHPLYAGFALPIQPGLVPLGPDPASTLEEFLLWESAPDAPLPARDVAGRFQVGVDTGVILVLLPGGRFTMGAQANNPEGRHHDPRANINESPLTEVSLDPFFLSKYELTQGQWLAATGANPSAYYDGYSFRGIHAPVDLRHPVERVSWFDCQQQLRRLGLLLPTEAQWEYAARAGTDSIYSGTSELAQLSRFANVAGTEVAAFYPNHETQLRDPYVIHAPVGSFEPNAFGLHDMSGNVWEWCRDHFAGYFVDPVPGDGARSSLSDNRVYRGGAAGMLAAEQRVTLRTEEGPELEFNGLGVRPVRAVR